MNALLLRSVVGLTILTAIVRANAQPPKVQDDSPAEQLRIHRPEQSAKALAQQYEQGKKRFLAVSTPTAPCR